MSVDLPREVALDISPVVASGWVEHGATWLSHVTAPPVMAVAAALLSVQAVGPNAWGWLLGYIALVVALPLLYLALQVARGQIADFHLPRRAERVRPYLVTLLAAMLGWALLRWGGAPTLLVILAAATALQTACLFAVTLRWKISAHTAAASGLVVLAWALGSAALPILIATLGLVAWARVRLRRHTVGQVLAGAVVGGLGLALVLSRAGYPR